MRKWKMAALCMCMGLLITGCGAKESQPENTANSEKTEKTEEELAEEAKQAKLDLIEFSAYDNVTGLELEPGTYFSIIGRSSSKEYWKAVEAGAKAAVADINEALGYEGSDKVKVVYSAPTESDNVGEQVSILDEELSRYPDALGISVIDIQSCHVQFDLAAQNSIPIVLFDSLSDYQGVMAKVSTDNRAAAKEAAVHMAEALEDQGEVLVYVNDSVSTSAKDRVDGFRNEIQDNHPDVSIAGVYYKDKLDDLKKEIVMSESESDDEEASEIENTAEETEELSTEEIQSRMDDLTEEDVLDYILLQHPDVRGIYTSNGETALAMVSACERADKEGIQVITYDADSEVQQAIEDGKIYGTILQNPYGIGYATIIAEARSILEMGNEAEVNTGYVWLSADNYQDEEMKKLYSQVK